jgi:hypothetical protein
VASCILCLVSMDTTGPLYMAVILLISKFLLFRTSTASAHAQNTCDHSPKMTSGGGSSDPRRMLVTVLQQCSNQLSQSVSFAVTREKRVMAKPRRGGVRFEF